jgi:hypothetical protein
MSLNKKKLISEVERGLNEQGFTLFKNSLTKTDGLFIKKIKPDLYLTLGLNVSRFGKNTFTGDFYLSKTTNFASVWGDIPNNSYVRISSVLNENEKKRFLGEEYEPNMVDRWWNTNSTNVYENFLNAVQCAEINFITPELIKAINNSNDVAILSELTTNVISTVKSKDKRLKISHLMFTPPMEINNIPVIWFKATELILSESKETLDKKEVNLLASDAYRTYILNLLKDKVTSYNSIQN